MMASKVNVILLGRLGGSQPRVVDNEVDNFDEEANASNASNMTTACVSRVSLAPHASDDSNQPGWGW